MDGGHTWSNTVTVAGATNQKAVFQPAVVVDASGGVDVTYFALSHGRVNLLGARSGDQGATFGRRRQITSRPFDPSLANSSGGSGQQWWIGDYQGLAVAGATIHPFWNDTSTGRLEIFRAAVPAA